MPISTFLNAAISLVASWLLYTIESLYLGGTIQTITQLYAPMGLLINILIFLANFVALFWILSIVFERLS